MYEKNTTLAPLEPRKYLNWIWDSAEGRGRPLTPMEWGLQVGLTAKEASRELVKMAALARRDQRMEAILDGF